PKISDIIIRSSEMLHLFDTPLLLARNYGLTFEQKVLKRGMDIVCSLLLILVTSPLMLIATAAIRLYDHGPVLFKQKRLTIDGKEFYVYKFRSMIVDAEKDGVARLATKNDSRITPVGKVIRKLRIDELPQLFNVLSGDMSLVGPRPERPEIAAEYEQDTPEFAYRLKVKAGLTGYAQVYGKYNTTAYDKLKLDLMYIESYSILVDIKILIMTFKILFMEESTEGLDEDQTTASTVKKTKKDE
ncbi:MAG TPA: sugar transferase, partial [Candidatus Egerieimonas faecigallinarum]|nr:sugar transferase [Candidatus Egerieimonas faecigallinarum]